MPDALLVLEVDGSIESANRAALELLGHSRDEILELPAERVLGEGGAASVIERCGRRAGSSTRRRPS
ncbi:PAS domain-containing protein [Sorangium sp. So ce834]|uniref:PAS domain-containing protein n=1 Tax=Sorangium sp. So ce834 TaxID=3133321 RepID=UPI003F63F789